MEMISKMTSVMIIRMMLEGDHLRREFFMIWNNLMRFFLQITLKMGILKNRKWNQSYNSNKKMMKSNNLTLILERKWEAWGPHILWSGRNLSYHAIVAIISNFKLIQVIFFSQILSKGSRIRCTLSASSSMMSLRGNFRRKWEHQRLASKRWNRDLNSSKYMTGRIWLPCWPWS